MRYYVSFVAIEDQSSHVAADFHPKGDPVVQLIVGISYSGRIPGSASIDSRSQRKPKSQRVSGRILLSIRALGNVFCVDKVEDSWLRLLWRQLRVTHRCGECGHWTPC